VDNRTDSRGEGNVLLSHETDVRREKKTFKNLESRMTAKETEGETDLQRRSCKDWIPTDRRREDALRMSCDLKVYCQE